MARKKAAAGHGGAWKVAYADFVTAMMALFMVLWISAQDQKILIATSQYFQNPFQAPMLAASGVLPSNSQSSRSQGPDKGERQRAKHNQMEMAFLNSVASDFYKTLRLDQDITDKPIEIQVTADGLRLTVFDRARKPVFVGNTAEFTEWGRFVMQNLSWTVDRHKFRVTIDGHTKAQLDLGPGEYTPWELSADRANAARRALVHYAVDPALIDRVTGYADTRPVEGESPEAESNQRITLSLSLGKRPSEPAPTQSPSTSSAPPASAP
ncbi:flagellar motor protein MotB [Opitutus terrae]|uniref:OmpA/MotB domain protein n=1 Tax=Opitutus terrae (strain DSM 11246 / JCM 15787 / PB90-1) TaxID=452637 RepID=B1ZR23_OPITP|nr:flagellar motor protein MotB [Opitutus terrae]ACB73690.1 OmpA/MotB domain protein [Opitutus terrae PB90-1]